MNANELGTMTDVVVHDMMPSAELIANRTITLLESLEGKETPPLLVDDLQKINESANRLLNALKKTRPEDGRPETRAEARHELATPLNHIIGYCELWIEEDDPTYARIIDEFWIVRALAWRLLHRITLLIGPGN